MNREEIMDYDEELHSAWVDAAMVCLLCHEKSEAFKRALGGE